MLHFRKRLRRQWRLWLCFNERCNRDDANGPRFYGPGGTVI